MTGINKEKETHLYEKTEKQTDKDRYIRITTENADVQVSSKFEEDSLDKLKLIAEDLHSKNNIQKRRSEIV